MRPTTEGGTWVWNWGPVWIYQARCQALNMEAVQKAWEAQDRSLCITKYRQDLYDATEIWTKGVKEEGLGMAWGLWYSRVANDGGIGLSYYTKNNGLFVYNEFYGPPTATQLEKESTLADLQSKFWTDYVMGATDDFDGFVANWKSQGGDAWTAEANVQYAALAE
jgi:putative aldouronate transport system substrate-binding protein